MRKSPLERKPWPMKWVVLAIIAILVPFTWLNLHYRKKGPAFRPYEDIKDRANTSRLLSAGYQRIVLPAQRPADRMTPITSAVVNSAPGGLPEDLRTTLVNTPLLPSQITNVAALPSVSALQPYVIRFACTMSDHKGQLAGADLYVKDDDIVITPDFEKLTGEFLARSTENIVELTVPAGALKPGQYHVTLVGAQSSRTWTVNVK